MPVNMKLMTKEILKALPKLYATDGVPLEEKTVICKFFGGSRGTWYVFEGDVQPDGDIEFFGYVVSPQGAGDEMGYFTLNELKSARFPPFGLPIERDLHFTPKPMGELLRKKGAA